MKLFYKNKVRRWRMFAITTLVLVSILLLNIFLSYIFSVCYLDHQSLSDNGWSYKPGRADVSPNKNDTLRDISSSEGWKSTRVIGQSLGQAEYNLVYYKTTLPNKQISDPHLQFQTNDHAFEVYLDNKAIYSFGNFEKFDYKHSPGSPVHLIALPDNFQGKELIIAMKAVSPERLGIVRDIELDSKSNHFISIFKTNISILILGCLNIIIGSACALIGIVKRLGRRALFSLGFSFIVVGIWTISENALTQLFHFRPQFWYYVSVVSFYLIPVSIYKFIRDVSYSYRHIMNALIYIHLLSFFVFLSLDLAGLMPIIKTIVWHFILTGFSYTTCLILSVRAYIKKSIMLLIYPIGMLIFSAFSLYDILGWYFEAVPWRINISPWGVFIFQMGLIYVLITYLHNIQERFLLYQEKIRCKNDKIKEKEKQIDQVMEYDKVRTEFFANISHELRTPLNIISTTVQLVRMYNKSGIIEGKGIHLEKYLDMMNQNCNRLMKLVNNIIDITKIDSGFYKLNFKRMNIVNIVENITLSIREYANNKGIELVFDTTVEEKSICCDPDAIERIMLNLLSNAIKFSNQGDKITVNLIELPSDIKIEVIDTGIGIPREKQQKIFDRFVQVDKSFTRCQEGSGIGLTLVKSLVEMHKGQITVESELDKGSKFTIIFPATNEIIESTEYQLDSTAVRGKVETVSIEFSDIYNI